MQELVGEIDESDRMNSSSILIQNIYYMLAYAFSMLRQSCFEKVGGESFDNIYNLFAEILSIGVGQQLKRGLYREYIARQDSLTVLRGRIDFPGTMKSRFEGIRKLSCEYDDLSENNIFNQIIKTTVLLLIGSPDVDSKHKNDLKKEVLFFSDVDKLDPRKINWSNICFKRNNQTYRILIGLCNFILHGMLLSQEGGSHKLPSFMDERSLDKLYEKFILEYYRREHSYLHANASQIPWALDDDCRTMLPEMNSDITLSYGKKTLIIDAKFYAKNTQCRYDKPTLHSQNLYQIFTYVKNKAKQDGFTDHEVAGLLLYARTSDEIQPNADFSMSGNRISVRTLDLNTSFENIREQLDEIAREMAG